MGNTSKSYSLLLFLILASSLMFSRSVSASLKPAVTEFSLKLVDNSYDVPPSPASSTDLYTGEVTTTTVPGYHVEVKSIVVTIKNPSGVDAYNFRWKAHDDSTWVYTPFDTEADHSSSLSAADAYGVSGYASDSEYTVFELTFIPTSLTSVDVQVQALYGDYRAEYYGHPFVLPGGPTYDFHFEGQASYWSSTQTLTINSGEDTTFELPTSVPPTQTQTLAATENPTKTPSSIDNGSSFNLNLDQTTLFVLAAVIAVLVLAAIIFAMRRTNIPNPPPPPESAAASCF
jgi:hypothetical protein